jgi:hypothetical protein
MAVLKDHVRRVKEQLYLVVVVEVDKHSVLTIPIPLLDLQ